MAGRGSESAVKNQPGAQAPRLRLAKVEAIVLRAPVETPVQTSFGIMYDRPAVLVRVEDRGGMVGWGEIWCNFPAVGAEHRARMLESCVAPILLEQDWDNPLQAFGALSQIDYTQAGMLERFMTVGPALAIFLLLVISFMLRLVRGSGVPT